MNAGCHTKPTSVVCALSGFRKALHSLSWRTCCPLHVAEGRLLAVQKSLLTEPFKPEAGKNSSDRLGARMSRDCRARRRMPGIGVSQVKPTFQVLASPAVL